MRRDCEISAVSSLLGHPLVAAALGALLGVLFTLISHRASGFVTPRDPMRGMAVYGAVMLARMTLAIGSLGVLATVAPAALAPFGFALGLSFIAGLGFEALKASRIPTSHTPA